MNPTVQLREVVDYSQGSSEMQVNNLTELPFRKWIKRELLLKGPIEYKDALDRGAYAVGCGQQAIRRHIDKLIGGGELRTFKDENTRKKKVKLMAKGEASLLSRGDGRIDYDRERFCRACGKKPSSTFKGPTGREKCGSCGGFVRTRARDASNRVQDWRPRM